MNRARQRALRAFVARGALDASPMALPPGRVIPGDDSRPRPLAPYATVLVGRDRQIGSSDAVERIRDDGRVWETVHQVWEALVYVQFHRAGANERARRFGAWIDTPEGLLWEERMGLTAPPVQRDDEGALLLDAMGRVQYERGTGWGPRAFPRMAIQEPIGYRQIDEIVGDAMEERAGIDLVVQYGHHEAQDTGRIDEVQVTVHGQEPLNIEG